MAADDVHLFGIRHHGPGSARSLVHALTELEPDIVLVEGPPDADDLLPFAGRNDLEPPVAILVYATDHPGSAVIYPFAAFSPEWQAIRYAVARGVPVRFIDLPQALQLRRKDGEAGERSGADPDPPGEGEGAGEERPGDPLQTVAVAAGYSDVERWWDHLVESRAGSDVQVFTAIHEMMTAVRNVMPRPPSLRERRREAHMRRAIREARRQGHSRMAVVCGAWHTPALAVMPPAREDDALLRGLSKVKTSSAWVPWSYERLSYASGYGAGIESPAWYELLWEHRGAPGARWAARVARLLRDRDVPTSSAHVIETCRLADALAAVRGRPLPGLPEYQDAAMAVLGAGEAVNLRTIARPLHYDGRLGRVPHDFPAAPLQRDLAAQQKRLRLQPKADERTLELDLRQAIDRDRSHLLRRLGVLDIEWGTLIEGVAGKGTFREVWTLRWDPEFAVALIDSSRYGHTVESASSTKLIERSSATSTLGELVGLLEDALFADIEGAVPPLVSAIESRAAAAADVAQLLDSLPPLARVYRYGNVRETDVALVGHILTGLIPRVFIGIPRATTNIDDDAARKLWERLRAADAAIGALANEEFQRGWYETAARIASNDAAHPLLAGLAHRLLYDASIMSFEELSRALSFALSPGGAPAAAASWVEGLLSGGAMFLIHDERLRSLIDGWLRGTADDHFMIVLPLLRRTFSAFPVPERRALAERLKRAGLPDIVRAPVEFDVEAARRMLPILQTILGTDPQR